MPARVGRKVVKLERKLCEAAELDSLYLRRTLESQAGQRPPIFRAASLKWDWICPCGNLVWTPKHECPMCSLSRCYGTTAVGSIRGVLQSTAIAVKAREQQRLVPGFNVSQPTRQSAISGAGGGGARAQVRGTWADVVRNRAADNIRAPAQEAPLVSAQGFAADDDIDENFDDTNMTIPEHFD